MLLPGTDRAALKGEPEQQVLGTEKASLRDKCNIVSRTNTKF